MEFEFARDLLDALRQARSVGVITGAGMSAPSGIPTYRGEGGLYDDPETGDRTVEALSGPTLPDDPDPTWQAVTQLALAARAAAPNAGHTALVALENRVERFVLLTQNVDGLHEAAGSTNVIDIHGNLRRTTCQSCRASGAEPDWESLRGAPRCPCGGVLRPDVVLFEEMLPTDKVGRMQRELLTAPPDVVMAIGTTAAFAYICEPVHMARMSGRTTVEINPEPTTLSGAVDHRIEGSAHLVLPALVATL